jgi:putative aldouronate transport system permease protein
MAMKRSPQRTAFLIFDYAFVFAIALLCVFPLVHVLSLSFSSATAAAAGRVSIFPVDFSIESYVYVAGKAEFWTAFGVSILRIGLVLPLSLLVTVMAAYPLSKSSRVFRARPFYTYFFLITMLFSGGLIPWYLTIKTIGLTNSIWALVVPGLVQVFNTILLMNFIRDLPSEIEEAAFVDGAGPMTMLFRIILPLMKPALATISLFIIVGNWNEWFNGIILMDVPSKYPLQSYLQSIISPASNLVLIDPKNLELLKKINERTFRAAQIFIAMFPVLILYPFLQKYFTKGLVLGSVKG